MSKIRLVWLLIAVVSSCLTSSILHTSNNVKRVKKATTNGDSTYVIDKLSRTARVITAISMLNGLSDGSIETDHVISELLNLGSSDLKSLEAFGKTKVDTFVDNLASFDEKLKDRAKKIQDYLNLCQKTKESWKAVGDISKLPDDATYKKLDSIKSLDLNNLKSLAIDKSVDLLDKFSTLNDGQVQTLQKSLMDIISELQGTEKLINFKETLDILNRLKPFGSISQICSLLVKIMTVTFDTTLFKTEIGEIETNFKSLKQLTSPDANAPLDLMNTVIASRFLHLPTTRINTAGFVDGFNDLKKIPTDLNDDWFLKNVHPATKIDGIGKLVQLEASMKAVDDQWKSIATEEVYNSVKQIASAHTRLSALKSEISAAKIATVIRTIQNCKTTSPDSTAHDKWTEVAKSSSELNRRITALSKIHSIIANKHVTSIINSLSSKTSLKDTQETKEFLQTLGYQLKIVDPATPINTDGLKLTDTAEITDFATSKVADQQIKMMNCFDSDLKDDFEKIVEASLASVEVRELKKDQKMQANVKKVTSKLFDTADSLKSIRTAVDKLKDDQSNEMKSLVVLKDLQKHSTQFGEAVNALVLAKKVSEKSKDFQLFLDYSASLEKMSPLLGNGDDAMKYWGDVGQTNGDVLTLITGVTDWLNKLKVSKDAKLADFSSLFNGLSQLNDLDLKTDDRLVALQLLSASAVATNHKDMIKDSKTKLLELSKLDLKFSRFDSSIQSMQQTLSDVSDLLAKDYSPPPKPIPPVPKPNAKPQKLMASTKEPRESSTEAGLPAGEWIMANWWVIIVGVVIVLFFVWLAAFWFLRSKSQDSEKWNKRYRILTLNCGKKYDPPISRVIIPKKPRQGSETTPSTGHPPQPPPDGAAIKKSVEVQPHIDQNERDRDENDRDEDRVRRRNAQQLANENNMNNIEEVATAREPTVRRERSAASVAVAIDENEQYIIRNNVLLDNEGNSAEEGLLSTVAEVEAENERLNLNPHPRPSEKAFSNQRYNEVAEERERARADAQRKKQEEIDQNRREEQERRDAFKRYNLEYEENERKKKEEEERKKKEKEKKEKKSKKSKKTKSKESKEKRGGKSKDKSNKKMIQ